MGCERRRKVAAAVADHYSYQMLKHALEDRATLKMDNGLKQ